MSPESPVPWEPGIQMTGALDDSRICENKAADQLRGNRATHQRLCFTYINRIYDEVKAETGKFSDYSSFTRGFAEDET